MIQILIADDSPVMARLLTSIFEKESDFSVVGVAKNGREAVEMAGILKPDLITMDVKMPVMDGFDATRMIMSIHPIPIVIVSSAVNDKELSATFRAIQEGALAVIQKPQGLGFPEYQTIRNELIQTVRAMAKVDLSRCRKIFSVKMEEKIALLPATPPTLRKCEMIAIGCSTGGPRVLQEIFSVLPGNVTVPIVVVQHISHGFIDGLISWLKGSSVLNFKLASQDEYLLPGTVYFAPDDYHLQIVRDSHGLKASLLQSPAINEFRPSITPLFTSVAIACPGASAGVLLTGMGADGAKGLLAMRKAGCHTFVQDEASCVVNSMPHEAIVLGAVDNVVKLGQLPDYISMLARWK